MLHSLNHYRNNHFIEKVHFITFMQVIGYNTSKIITDSFTENALTYKYTVRSTVSVCKPDWLLMKSHPLESTANKLRGLPSDWRNHSIDSILRVSDDAGTLGLGGHIFVRSSSKSRELSKESKCQNGRWFGFKWCDPTICMTFFKLKGGIHPVDNDGGLSIMDISQTFHLMSLNLRTSDSDFSVFKRISKYGPIRRLMNPWIPIDKMDRFGSPLITTTLFKNANRFCGS